MKDYVYFVVNVLVIGGNHLMMECDHDIFKNIRDYYISQIVTKHSAMANLPSDTYIYDLVPRVATWIYKM